MGLRARWKTVAADIVARVVGGPHRVEDVLSRRQFSIIPTWTDNRGNGSALNKLMSTHFPSSALLMELATHMKREGIKANVQWSPRESNREADRLANGAFTGFSPEYRIHLDVGSISWYILEDALVMDSTPRSRVRCSERRGVAG